MLAGAFLGAELKAQVSGDQRVATLDAAGEGIAPHVRQLLKLAAEATLGRERNITRARVQPEMDERRMLAQPSLKR